MTSKYRADNVDLLLPGFKQATLRVLDRMKELGFDPVPFDTLRTPEEAVRNAKKGVGIVDSVHMYGAACDVICGRHGWSCRAAKCKHYSKLGAVVEAEGLVWGGRFPSRPDQPHFQGVEVWEQKALRALGRDGSSIPERDALVVQSILRRLGARR